MTTEKTDDANRTAYIGVWTTPAIKGLAKEAASGDSRTLSDWLHVLLASILEDKPKRKGNA